MLTIRRDIVKETVLAGLNQKLMQPEIMRTMAMLGVLRRTQLVVLWVLSV